MEHALTRTAAENDPDFLVRVARSWTDAVDQDGAEPSEEQLRQLQGAFIRRPRHGLHHLEIFATAEQFEHLLTVMNTATNPRTTSAAASSPRRPAEPAARRAARRARAGDTCHDGPGAVPDTAAVPVPRASQLLRLSVGRRGVRLRMGMGLRRPCPVGFPERIRPRCWISHAAAENARRPGRGAAKLPSPPGPCPPPEDSARRSWSPSTTATCSARLDEHRDGPAAPAQRPADGPAPGRTGTLLFTGPVTASTARKIACDADIIPVLLGGEGRILDIGRASRIFPPHIRKALTARDQGCAFPGCTIPAPWCEAHHITYWSRGGTTGTDNGTLLCSHHHHLIHKEQWTIQLRTGIPWFIPPPHLDPRQRPRRNHYFHPTTHPLTT